MTVAFFAISGLDMLKSIDVLKDEKQKIIDWIYRLQVIPNKDESNLHLCGFRGSTTLSAPIDIEPSGYNRPVTDLYDNGHIAMTYTALLSLLILGDDLSRVNRRAILCGLKQLQLADGSFSPTPDRPENDMRFVYCACCVSHILNDWKAVDQNLACDYILHSQTYEGGFGQGPGLEAHGGSTFCAVASLVLMNRLYDTLSPSRIRRLKRWCMFRQESGFNGRPNKPTDTCYSFWVGATLKMLDIFDLSDSDANHSYLMDTQDSLVGGFAKWPDNGPDALHSYFGVCGLSLIGGARYSSVLCGMNAALNVSCDVYERLNELHKASSLQHSHQRDDMFVTKYTEHLRDSITCLLPALKSKAADESGSQPAGTVSKVMYCLGGLQLVGASNMLTSEVLHQAISSVCHIIQSSAYTTNYTADQLLNKLSSCKINSTEHSNKHLKDKILEEMDVSLLHCLLNSLLMTGDELDHIDRTALKQNLTKYSQTCLMYIAQDQDMQNMRHMQELDIECIYNTLCIAYILNDITIINAEATAGYLKSCLKTGGGFGKLEGAAADELTTYMTLASLTLLKRLHSTLSDRELKSTRDWCRQQLGPLLIDSDATKLTHEDLHRAFYILASLELLGYFLDDNSISKCRSNLVSAQSLVLDCQSSSPMKSYVSKTMLGDAAISRSSDPCTVYRFLCVLSLLHEPGLQTINVAVGLPSDSIICLRSVHTRWLQHPV